MGETKKGIIFDMDGTLWDSAEGVAKSWTRIVNKEYDRNREITVEEIHGVMGKTMDKIAEILFPELPEREREIVVMRFGLYGHQELTQKEVAEFMGISQSYISRLEKKIMLKLRKELIRQTTCA